MRVFGVKQCIRRVHNIIFETDSFFLWLAVGISLPRMITALFLCFLSFFSNLRLLYLLMILFPEISNKILAWILQVILMVPGIIMEVANISFKVAFIGSIGIIFWRYRILPLLSKIKYSRGYIRSGNQNINLVKVLLLSHNKCWFGWWKGVVFCNYTVASKHERKDLLVYCLVMRGWFLFDDDDDTPSSRWNFFMRFSLLLFVWYIVTVFGKWYTGLTRNNLDLTIS